MSIRYYIYQNQIKRLPGLAFDKKDSSTQFAAELARRISVGDEVAENEFVRLLHRWLLFIVRRKFSRSSHHEDILQDAFMLVLHKLKQGEVNKPDSITSYLRTTAINIGFDYLKKDKKFDSAIDQDYMGFIKDTNENILSQIIWTDKVKYVQQVIQELRTQRDKDILMDFYFNHLSKESICLELELTSEHFDRVIYRAKQRLKQLIEETDHDHTQGDKTNKADANATDSNIRNLFQSCLLKVFKLHWGAA